MWLRKDVKGRRNSLACCKMSESRRRNKMLKVMITKLDEKPVISNGHIGRKTFRIVRMGNNCGDILCPLEERCYISVTCFTYFHEAECYCKNISSRTERFWIWFGCHIGILVKFWTIQQFSENEILTSEIILWGFILWTFK